MLDLKDYHNAKRYLEKSGLTIEEAIKKLEKEITGSGADGKPSNK